MLLLIIQLRTLENCLFMLQISISLLFCSIGVKYHNTNATQNQNCNKIIAFLWPNSIQMMMMMMTRTTDWKLWLSCIHVISILLTFLLSVSILAFVLQWDFVFITREFMSIRHACVHCTILVNWRYKAKLNLIQHDL